MGNRLFELIDATVAAREGKDMQTTTTIDPDELTPTEYLVGEVLAARLRLGEQCWTFPTRVRPALKRLEERGLIDYKSGVVAKTCLAWFTEAGRGTFLDDDYELPNARVR